MTDAVKIALITAVSTIVSGGMSVLVIILVKRLEVKVDGRLTELLQATNAQGRQDERDSQSITVRGVPEEPRK